PSLQHQQTRLEHVEPSLQTNDICLAERRDVDRIRRLVDDTWPRKRQKAFAGTRQLELSSLLPRFGQSKRAQRIPEPGVDDERSVAKATLERAVVDRQRCVELGETALVAGALKLVVVGVPTGAQSRTQMFVLAVTLLEAADREVKELDRVPATQRQELRFQNLMCTRRQGHVGIGAVHGLEVRSEKARRVVDRRRARNACHHPLRKE